MRLYDLVSALKISESVHVTGGSFATNILVVPDLDQVVAASGNKPALLAGSRVRADQTTSKGCRGPADGVDAHSVGVEGLVGPVVVTELEHTDMAIGRSTGKKTSALMGSPGDHIDGGRVKGEIKDLGPRATARGRGCGLRLFPPNQDLAII